MKNTNIEWCDHTFNCWRGCTKVSTGCKNCYADTLSNRNPGTLGVWGKNGTRVVASETMWKQPLKWNAEATAQGVRKRVFCASLADVFEGRDTMPEAAWLLVEMARARLMQLIADTPNLDWLILTKRPENVVPMLEDLDRGARFFEHIGNVWLGTSVENQATADERIPHLLRVPAKVRFLSCEPLLGEVDLSKWMNCGFWEEAPVVEVYCGNSGVKIGEKPGHSGWHHVSRGKYDLNWCIVGGESGPKARPFSLSAARDLQSQCAAAGVAFFLKQLGEMPDGYGEAMGDWPKGAAWNEKGQCSRLALNDKKGGDMLEWPESLRVRQFPEVTR